MSKVEILRAQDYLGHIVEAIDRIHRYVEDLLCRSTKAISLKRRL